MVFGKKSIVILTEENMGYHPMVLSQFSIFWRKSTFFEGGGFKQKPNNYRYACAYVSHVTKTGLFLAVNRGFFMRSGKFYHMGASNRTG